MDFFMKQLIKHLPGWSIKVLSDRCLVAQQPTSDWRDEQWVMGYGLFVNTLVYSYLRLYEKHKRAELLLHEMRRFTITGGSHA